MSGFVQPLSKDLFDRAKELGVKEIRINFQGGSDEGYIYPQTSGAPTNNNEVRSKIDALERDLEYWAHDAYQYNGAGDGTDYGDDVTYNLETMEVTHSEWCMQRHDGPEVNGKMEVDDES